ncbi:MAG: magnesium transporter [Acidobacteria bacterium]|nr:magnesium transporter [Acidobacteriota bacterium]
MNRMVADARGATVGRVKELIIHPAETGSFVSHIALESPNSVHVKHLLVVPVKEFARVSEQELCLREGVSPLKIELPPDVVFLEKDLLDQQIIDVHGHKVVRVNDVDLVWECTAEGESTLRIAEVEVGLRGAMRRLLKGLPRPVVSAVAHQAQPRVIPWEFVDLIDRDPSRRVRLKIEQNRLAHMHPSDIADILEDLAPAERDAVFTSLDEELAAEALEEVEPKLQKQLIESLDSGRAADIVEEMDPGAAADLLSELSEERSEAILEEMEPEERQEVEELLEFPGDWAAGRMTTDYVHAPAHGVVRDAIVALRDFEGDTETISEIYLVDAEEHLKGIVPVARLLLAFKDTPLIEIADTRNVACPLNASGKQVAELFDKYNLRSLPVLEEEQKLAGVIYAEQVIALLRAEK